MRKISIAIVGVGNCASSLVQGINFYDGSSANGAGVGLMHRQIGGYRPSDIEVVAAFDIDRRKVGLDVSKAIFSPPNCTQVFCESIKLTGAIVKDGCVLDGYPPHMRDQDPLRTFLPLEKESTREDIIAELKNSSAELMVNYLPVGSEQATRFYAGCALEAGLGFVNNVPVFIASDPVWAKRFADKNLPLIGDDIKAQMGATIVHRALVDLFRKRGVKVVRTYQLNTGGNTDFLNMLNRTRLASKKTSETEAVQSVIGDRLADENIHIGPSDYVPWQLDNKIAFIRVEGRLFGDVPIEIDVKLSVEDSPNSAGVAIDAIRCCKVALDRGIGGVLHSAFRLFFQAYHRANDRRRSVSLRRTIHPRRARSIAQLSVNVPPLARPSNGFLLTHNLVTHLEEAGLQVMQISVDRMTPSAITKKSFKTILPKLDYFSDSKISLHITGVICADTLPEALAALETGLARGIPTKVRLVHANPLHRFRVHRGRRDELERFIDSMIERKRRGEKIHTSEAILNYQRSLLRVASMSSGPVWLATNYSSSPRRGNFGFALTESFLGAVCIGTIKVNWPATDSGEDRHVDAFVRSPRRARSNSTGQVTFLPRRKLSLFPSDRRWGLQGWIHRTRR